MWDGPQRTCTMPIVIKYPPAYLESCLTSSIINGQTLPNTHNYTPMQFLRTSWVDQPHGTAVAYIIYRSYKSGTEALLGPQNIILSLFQPTQPSQSVRSRTVYDTRIG